MSNTSVFIIGWKEEGERVFLRADNRAAVNYAKQTKLRLMQVNITQICQSAATDLLGL